MTHQPIRVLQILGIVAGGGVEAVIMNYYEHINRERVQFDFVVHNDSPVDITDKVISRGGKVYKITPYTKNVFAFMYDIYKIIKKNHYTIVHSNMNTLSVFSLFAAWLAGANVRILHNHSMSVPSETKRNLIKIILRPFAKLFANRYFACSRLAAEWMYGKGSIESGNVTVINNAIDLRKHAFDMIRRKDLRAQMGIQENYFVVGHVGRFMYQKNHDFLIDVFADAIKRKPNMVLLLIGDGPLKKIMEGKVNSLHIKDKVVFLGLRSDVQDLYNVMDLFVLPSYYEGLPVVGVEAQANGLPLLVSTNVTDELQLTDLVQYKSLEENRMSWVKCILSYKKDELRKNTFENMTVKGFNIEHEASKLENIYYQIKC